MWDKIGDSLLIYLVLRVMLVVYMWRKTGKLSWFWGLWDFWRK